MEAKRDVIASFEKLTADMDALDESVLQQHPALRAQVFKSARRLCQKIESPWQRIARMFWGEPWIAVSARIANDMGIFKTLHEQGTPISAAEISRATVKDEVLVTKLLRTLSAAGFLEQRDPNTYLSTKLSDTMLAPEAGQAIDFLFESGYPYFALIPEYIKDQGFVASTNMGAWQNFRKTDMSVYEWFGAHPGEMTNFVGLMKVWSATQEPWLDLYPVESLLESASAEGTLLVDVAGGGGRDIEAFVTRYPQYAGRVVLQDRPEEVQAAKVSKSVEVMPHDMFMSQPVKGARMYLLHSILHNYTDEKAKEILGMIKRAMKPNYSRLLAYEDTIRDREPTELSCGMDLTMMTTFGTGARTESEWKTLFKDVQLTLVSIYQSHQAGQCIMEFILPE